MVTVLTISDVGGAAIEADCHVARLAADFYGGDDGAYRREPTP